MHGESAIQTLVLYYLWDGEYYIPHSVREYLITDLLKKLKMEFQKEFRLDQEA